MPFRMEGGEIVGSLRLAFLAGAWIGHANHGAIEQHHRKPQPDKPPAEESEAYREGYEQRMSCETRPNAKTVDVAGTTLTRR